MRRIKLPFCIITKKTHNDILSLVNDLKPQVAAMAREVERLMEVQNRYGSELISNKKTISDLIGERNKLDGQRKQALSRLAPYNASLVFGFTNWHGVTLFVVFTPDIKEAPELVSRILAEFTPKGWTLDKDTGRLGRTYGVVPDWSQLIEDIEVAIKHIQEHCNKALQVGRYQKVLSSVNENGEIGAN